MHNMHTVLTSCNSNASAAAGEEKARFHWLKFALLAIAAGCYCGFGFTLCLLVSIHGLFISHVNPPCKVLICQRSVASIIH